MHTVCQFMNMYFKYKYHTENWTLLLPLQTMVHGSGVETGYKSKNDNILMMIIAVAIPHRRRKTFFFNLKGFGSFLLLQFLFLVYILLKTLLG